MFLIYSTEPGGRIEDSRPALPVMIELGDAKVFLSNMLSGLPYVSFN